MNDRAAMQSALILSGDKAEVMFELAVKGEQAYDGRLTAEQIARTWNLSADLVTLSACATALGKESGGEGFLGFSQALFLAGARSLVLSLWRVEDTATTLLMTRFYENLLGAFDRVRIVGGEELRPGTPLPKATALWEAKNWLRTMTWDKLELEPAMEAYVARGLVPVEGFPGRSETKNPFADQHFWAAFILTGDPD
jgi:CHAT domain-containing protein